MKRTYKKSTFYLEDIINPLSGITTGDTWNGWACPSFPLSSVNKILKNFTREGVKETNGEFYYFDNGILKCDEYDDGEIFQTSIIDPVIFEGKKYWCVGGYSWIWSEEEGEKKETYFIEYLNSKKGFQVTKKIFHSLYDCVKWGKKNIDNFNLDMVKES